MTLDEIKELMRLTAWTRDDLAEQLGICKNSIDRWFSTKAEQARRPNVAQCKLMRGWLNEAKLKPAQPAPKWVPSISMPSQATAS